jgi:hypothetical protein
MSIKGIRNKRRVEAATAAQGFSRKWSKSFLSPGELGQQQASHDKGKPQRQQVGAVDAPRPPEGGEPSGCKAVPVSAPAEEHACQEGRNGHEGLGGREEAKGLIGQEAQSGGGMVDDYHQEQTAPQDI